MKFKADGAKTRLYERETGVFSRRYCRLDELPARPEVKDGMVPAPRKPMKNRFVWPLSLLGMVLLATNAAATTYYIDYTGGSDSNNGRSSSAPFKVHPYMKGFSGSYSHSSGDRFIFKGGVSWPSSVFTMSISAGGSVLVPDYYGVDMTWYAGSSWTRPIFDQGGASGSTFVSFGADNVTVDNIEMTGFNWSSGGYGTCYVSLADKNNITLANCFFHGWTHNGSTSDDLDVLLSAGFGAAAGQVATNCIFDGTGPGQDSGAVWHFSQTARNCTVKNIANAFLVWSGGANCEVSGCSIGPINASFSGRHENGIEDLGCKGTLYIYKNVIHDTLGITVFVGGFNDTIYIYNNLIYNSPPSPIQLETRGGSGIVFIYNNTVDSSATPGDNPVHVVGGTFTAGTIQNNHFIGGTYDGSFGTLVIDHNLTQTSAQAAAAGYTSANGYRPTSATSPTVDAGFSLQSLLLFSTDRLGISRPQGLAWDIGAYEWGSGGGGGSTNVAPGVSAISQNAADVDPSLAGLQVFVGTTVQYSGSATDANNDPLTWQWIYQVNAGAEVVYQSGAGAVTPVSYTYPANAAGGTYTWILRVSDGQATSQSQLNVGVEATPPPPGSLTFEAESGTITAPFVVNGTYISQPSQTGVTDGGRAAYTFTITNAGSYVVRFNINAPNDSQNSIYFNIDAEPQDPAMIWDIPVTTAFSQLLGGWRGAGTYDANQYVPKIFSLSATTHTLIIRGREPNVQIDSLSILKLPPSPQNLRIVAGP